MAILKQTPHFRIDAEAEGVVSIVLDRPPWNILDTETLSELSGLLDSEVFQKARTVLLRGEGRGFCAGAAVEDHLPIKAQSMLESFCSVLEKLREIPVPTIAVVHGAALGGGLELACAADLLFAAEEARLGQPEIRLGAIAPAALLFLPERLGYHRAADLLLSGREVNGLEARTIGLADYVYPGSALLEEAVRYADRLASLSGPVLRACKEALRRNTLCLPTQLKSIEEFYMRRIVPLEDYTEGLNSFLEKRKPVWKHQ
ncbi:MAG: enoyl-CoA hydratase/isomerase family protein [Acidobacteria bacterium]|nr:enoyl-CoA hydratase/isomerase family protein [Acidobacteriota bacterium]